MPYVMQVAETELRGILREFDFKFEVLKALKETDDISLYKHREYPLFIIDTEEGRKLASDPSIVGREFDSLNSALAMKVWRTIKSLGIIDGPIIFEHVLRGGPGYRLREAAANEVVVDFYVRPRYVEASYRHHTHNEVELVYEGELNVKAGKEYTLIKPDTEATGRSSLRSIEKAINRTEAADSRITRIVLYGFISEYAFKVISDFAQKQGIEVYAIAVEDLTALASNGYDMPIYGIDEEAYNNSKILELAAIIPKKVLLSIAGEYFPGMDQPGDWSERQITLFNGRSFEKGNIRGHIEKSIKALDSLYKISRGQSWFREWHDLIYRSIKEKLLLRAGELYE